MDMAGLSLESLFQHEPGWRTDHWPKAGGGARSLAGHLPSGRAPFLASGVRGLNEGASKFSPALAGTAVAETPGAA